jgi:CHASE2 domain-containing sensor protein
MGKVLTAVCVIVMALPFVIFKGPPFQSTQWFNHTSQLLSFGAAILNLGLWSALVANRKRDPQLLAVSTGLGIAVTGAAISYGVRGYLAANHLWIPDAFMGLTFMASMVIWCWAFRPRAMPLA